jgi:hypothetical protein
MISGSFPLYQYVSMNENIVGQKYTNEGNSMLVTPSSLPNVSFVSYKKKHQTNKAV